MKTAIIFIDQSTNEKVCQIFEYENEEQKLWLIENYLNNEIIINMIDIDGFSYLQHKKQITNNFASVRDTGESIQGTYER